MAEDRPTDEAILNYEQSIRDTEANSVPLIDTRKPIANLFAEYEENASFLAKLQVY